MVFHWLSCDRGQGWGVGDGGLGSEVSNTFAGKTERDTHEAQSFKVVHLERLSKTQTSTLKQCHEHSSAFVLCHY